MGIKGERLRQCLSPQQLAQREGQRVTLRATVHNIRELGGVSFVILRTGRYLLQTVWNRENCAVPIDMLAVGDAVEVGGTVRLEGRAEGGVEIHLDNILVLNHPKEPSPLNLAGRKLKASLGTNLEYRTAALRHPAERAVFRISEGVVTAFREFMLENGFAEIHSPKIVGVSAEGGAEVFRLDYFGQQATLAQSPQFYKQTAVAFYDRVFEVGPVYRAELHNTSRHLNEYTGLDFEMGFIDSMEDVMEMEVGMLRHVMNHLRAEYTNELDLLGATLPEVGEVPAIRFSAALALLREIGGGKNKNDLTPEDEGLLCDYYKEKGEGEFVFVTHFPGSKRPFYVRDDPENPGETLSFDLLLRGLEITTGGQRIHEYDAQVEKFESRGLDPTDFESYISVHKVGLPPHGGLGIGLERLVMKLCGLSNIRQASLFPRDITHLQP